MKTLLVIFAVFCAVSAEAEPEADPVYYYRPYSVGYPSFYSYRYPFSYGHYGYHALGKRSAEAEPEADPATVIHHFNPTHYSAYSPYLYYGSYFGTPASTYPFHYIHKRSADPEPIFFSLRSLFGGGRRNIFSGRRRGRGGRRRGGRRRGGFGIFG